MRLDDTLPDFAVPHAIEPENTRVIRRVLPVPIKAPRAPKWLALSDTMPMLRIR